MNGLVRGLAAALLALTAVVPAAAAPLKLEAVVVLMRHGVRPPTKAQPMPVGVASDPWPSWPVQVGWLTPHGADALKLLGRYDRAAYAERGLLAAGGCPAPGAVSVWADTDERTIKSAEAWVEGFAPGCHVQTGHAPGEGDPLFSPLESEGAKFDGAKAEAAVMERLGPGGLAAAVAAQRARLDKLDAVLGCCHAPVCPAEAKACALSDMPAAVVPTKKGRPKLTGPLDLGATASEILMLEYTEGKPMAEVGWGRVTRAEIEGLLALHPAQYQVLIRPPYIGRANAEPLARRMLASIRAPKAGRAAFTLLLGHDTNIASLGSMLDLHWKVDSFPADDPPPGGALGFERLTDEKGQVFVRAFYEGQTMDQIRNLEPLSKAHPPSRQYLTIPGCPEVREGACPLDRLAALIDGQKP